MNGTGEKTMRTIRNRVPKKKINTCSVSLMDKGRVERLREREGES